eukprot:Phypoly_transcript_03673.p1 GENE.Phypoly_transcript_03673~~Phypoly_transcript_03673.p1  ORF type:complete len:675 (+),score=95.36 Phypoly_transcript_03673:213-2237(+)
MRLMCKRRKVLKFLLKSILEDGGEGVVLRKPASIYESGRSPYLVKMKAAQSDSEGLVVAFSTGSVTLKLPSGEKFEMATDAHYQIGDIVTLEYESHARKDVPVGPKIVRIRTDVSWEDVLRDYARDNSLRKSNTKELWNLADRKKARKFFEDFATGMGMDPLIAETWYSIPRQLLEERGAHPSLFRMGGYPNVLISLFPEIGLDERKFPVVPRGYWSLVRNRKNFFDEFAFRHNFNPLIPSNWYSLTDQKIREFKSAGVLNWYGGSFTRALMHVYPDIGLERKKFAHLPSGHWSDRANRKQFFDAFARENHFDPLVSENWYSVSRQAVLSKPGSSVLEYYDRSLVKALEDVYPDIGLRREMFAFLHRGYWTESKNRKRFFDELARDLNFDPLVPANWYSVTTHEIEQRKYGRTVLYYYGWSLSEALTHLYPNIGLQKHKFFHSSGHWQNVQNRKRFFDDFARDHKFDPLSPENWYPITSDQIKATRNAGSVLRYYGGRHVKALQSLYPDIGLKSTKFALPKDHWESKSNRRALFDEIANSLNFDPLVATNWYRVTPKMVSRHKHSKEVLMMYSERLHEVLLDLYPDIGLNPDSFLKNGDKDEENSSREFFDQFARANKFDPLIPGNWYSIPRHRIVSMKGSGSILRRHSGSFVKALVDVYPHLHFQKHLFLQLA